MEYLIFTGYLVLFAWLVTKTRFFLRSGLSKSQLVILFLLKVIAGIFYGWMGIYYGGTAQMIDTWAYHYNGLAEYHLLGSDPSAYFTNLFHSGYEHGYRGFFDSSDSYWNDLKGNIFIKFLSIFNIFSFGYYYVNVIFYSFIAFFGPIAFYRVMKDVFPRQKNTVLAGSFFIPSFLYWGSGLHKEGLLFLGIGLIIFAIYFAQKKGRISAGAVGSVLLGLLLLFLLRSFTFAIMLPAIFCWLLVIRWKPRKPFLVFAGVYLGFCLLFFTAKYISPAFDFPKSVAEKQQAFIANVGSSSLPARELEPTVASFILNTPQAISFSTFRPYPGDIRHILSLFAAVEVMLVIFVMLLFVFMRRKGWPVPHPVIYFCFFFSLSLLLAIGFSVNNLGAICRYRSVVLPLLLTPMLAAINLKGIASLFTNGNSGNAAATGNTDNTHD